MQAVLSTAEEAGMDVDAHMDGQAKDDTSILTGANAESGNGPNDDIDAPNFGTWAIIFHLGFAEVASVYAHISSSTRYHLSVSA